MLRSAFCTLACLLISSTGLARAASQPPAIRHLVYNFTYGIQANVAQSVSAIDSGASSNTTNSSAGSGDSGTITVDVTAVQPDSGLVVNISEQGREERSTPPATCVVYGTTLVICDPNKKVNDEEIALLRFLGRNFVDPVKMDPQNHWQVSTSNATLTDTTDFRITSNNNGMLVISENRSTKTSGLGARDVMTDGKITYNLNKTVPVAIAESTSSHEERGIGLSSSERTEITLSLAADSMASQH